MNRDDIKKKRKVPTIVRRDTVKSASIQDISDTAIILLNSEIIRLKQRAMTNKCLTTQDATQLQKYVKSLVELSREERERAKEEDASDMTDDELIESMQESIKKLEEKKEKERK